MQSTMMEYPLTLVHLLERAGRYFSHVEIVSRLPDGSRRRGNYGQFYLRARALARALREAGLRQGDRVGTLMWNHQVHLEAYFGIPVAGGVLHTLNPRLHPGDLAYTANDAADRFLIVDDALVPVLEQFRREVAFERIFVFSPAGAPASAGDESYESFLEGAAGDFVYPEIDEREAAAMCYTSGTTGRPRGMVYSHRSTVLHCYNLALAGLSRLSADDVVMTAVPMFAAHAAGIPIAATMMGAKQVLPGAAFDPESLLDLCESEQVTWTAGVPPSIWSGVLELLDREPGRWRLAPGLTMATGGTAVPEALVRGLDRHGITVLQAWGMTETSSAATVSVLRPDMRDLPEAERCAVRVKQGYPLPFVEVRVVGDDGREVAADGKAIGELQVRGAQVIGSYYHVGRDPENFTADGWLRTGDVATVDRDGYIKITDRSKDLIKSGNEWISSADLENAIVEHPAVAEAAVIGVPHPKWEERPVAIVVLKAGERASKEELGRFLEDRFARWWLPDDYAFVDAMPRGSTGKVLKSKLREQFVARLQGQARNQPG